MVTVVIGSPTRRTSSSTVRSFPFQSGCTRYTSSWKRPEQVRLLERILIKPTRGFVRPLEEDVERSLPKMVTEVHSVLPQRVRLEVLIRKQLPDEETGEIVPVL